MCCSKNWCCMVNENLIILFFSGWIGAVYGQCEIYYIIFSGCLALDCWLVKKFSYSLLVGKSNVTDHLSGISVSRYIFVGQQTVSRYIYVRWQKLYRRHLQRQIGAVGIHLYRLMVCRYNGFYRLTLSRCIGLWYSDL